VSKPPETSIAVEPHASTGVNGYDEFEIDVEAILRDQLPRFFTAVAPAPLTAENVAALPERAKGAYMLLLDDVPVYAGKTDTRHGFRDRLNRHSWTVQGRKGLDPARLSFKAVRIMVFSAFDVEAILIAEMKKEGVGSLPWNNSGFGSNDPGKNRDGQQPADFDQWYPVDIDFPIDGLPPGEMSLSEFLRVVKGKLPFLIRNAPLPDDIRVTGLPTTSTVRDLLKMTIAALPPGWQVTVLHGRIIIYKENRDYPYKIEMFRS
jgi:hypothetical protein